ncbi:Phosphoglucomutase-3 [Phytophthora pseudosyringae]|uniref:Phosphoglucomutase-3 n=1 Tax=Phytophthora pseudosyringae TaxID=221518 RepID=A0A8T1VJB6_9STRA|nr:Phosphoglucomutase-3 [Phytophthora pseudosyringae]
MPQCSRCGVHSPSGRFCSECGAPFANAPPNQAGFQQQRVPPRFQEQASFEERDQKSLLYQQQPNHNSPPPAIPVVYVDGDGAADRANGRNLSSVSSASSTGGQQTAANGGRVRSSTGGSGVLKSRYSDHPNCDVCGLAFDVTKRRHQCRACGRYICGSCSPLLLLIPEGDQIEGARGYDPSIPQRACLHCAPQLRPLQEDLVARYAKANAETAPHEAKSRLHVPFSPSLEKECTNAADIVGNFFRNDSGASGDRAIPISLLENAHGLAIMTIVKVGFLLVGKVGTGIVISRLPDGSWSAPSAIGTVGLGGGFEIGGEVVEVMIILGSPAAVQVFHSAQVNLGAGLDVAVGPYGRSAAAAAAISSSGLNGNYSYSISRGLYAGISLQGSVIATRNDLNRKFYGQDLEASALLSGAVGQPVAARPLYEALDRAMRGIEEHKEVLAERSRMMGVCRACNCQVFVAHPHQVWNKKCKTCNHIH